MLVVHPLDELHRGDSPATKGCIQRVYLLGGINLNTNLILSAILSGTSIASGTSQNMTNTIRYLIRTGNGGGASGGANDDVVNPLLDDGDGDGNGGGGGQTVGGSTVVKNTRSPLQGTANTATPFSFSLTASLLHHKNNKPSHSSSTTQ